MEKRGWRSDLLFLGAMLALGLALRLDLLLAVDFRLDADEAIVGLMAKHLLERGTLPVFYYGQHYMGSLEALLAAVSFAAFGLSPLALKLVPLTFSLALIALLYLIAEALGGRRAGRLAALFAAVPPAMLLLWSGKARGGFIEIVCIGAAALALTLRWLRQERPGSSLTVLIGLLLGLGWWVNNQIVYFMLPIGLWLALALRREPLRLVHHALAGLAAFFVGGAPFWVYNVRNGFVTFDMLGRSGWRDAFLHLDGLFDTALPIILGARRYWQTEDLFPGGSLLMWLLYGGLLGALLIRRRRAFARLLRLEIDKRRPVELLLALLAAVPAVYCLSAFGALAKDPRYLLPIYVAVIVLAALSVSELSAAHRRAGCAAAAALVCFNLMSLYWGGRAVPGEPHVYGGERVSLDHTALLRWLKERDVHWIRTNYWIGYRLAFESAEDVRFVLFNEPGEVRIEEYEEQGRAQGLLTLPLVLVPKQAEVVRTALDTLGYTFRSDNVSGYTIFYGIEPGQSDLRALPAPLYRGEATHNPAAMKAAFDGDAATRWGSAVRQQPGMRFSLELTQTRAVRALRYDLGGYWHDFPRALRIVLEGEDGSRHELCSAAAFAAVRYFLYGVSEYRFYFAPFRLRRLELTEEGADEVFDWSIAELTVYE